jgi:hypothetical protein
MDLNAKICQVLARALQVSRFTKHDEGEHRDKKNANFLNKMGNISGSSCALLRSGKVAQEYGHQRSD